jgi:tetratricopeptide (TPR) repeat protein
MYKVIERGVTFIELVIGVLLPWKLRCRYSKFLMKLDGIWLINFDARIISKEKQRNFERFLGLSYVYAQEGNLDLAIANLKNALEIDSDNRQAAGIHLLLASLYKSRDELDKYVDEIVNFYKIYKHQKKDGKSHRSSPRKSGHNEELVVA